LNGAAGMLYLEQKGIVHCDIGARNLLVSESDGAFMVKIADFGLSRQKEDELQQSEVFPVRV
jgi:serine/threonine protein kinase